MKFQLKHAYKRYEILLRLSERLKKDAQLLEKAKIENQSIRRSLAHLRFDITEHLHLLEHSIRKREKRANDPATHSQRKKASKAKI